MLQLAEELGGKALTLPGHSVADTVLDCARRHNITKILVGKPIYPRWRELLRGSVVDQIARASGSIDLYVISGAAEGNPVPVQASSTWRPRHVWRPYVASLTLVVAGSALNALLRFFFSPANLVMIYLLVVVLAAIYLGRGPSFLAAILSVLVFDFFFVPPQLTLGVSDTEYLLTFAALLVVGLVISSLTARVREQADAARERETETAELYALSRDLAVAFNLREILDAVVAHISQTFSRQVVILLPRAADDRIEPRAASGGFVPDENQLAVAEWSFRHGLMAGRGTDTLPSADIRCFPMKTAHGVVGVLSVKPMGPSSLLTPAQRDLLQAFASQAALAIERAQLAEQAQQAELLQSTEKLQRTLLNMISHDLRTPLVSITGALSSLQEDGASLDEATRAILIENATGEAERLNRLVGNLLDMTRIEAGALRVNRELYDVQDVIGSSLAQLEPQLEQHPVTVRIAPNLPLVLMDFVLLVQVLTNLLDNAAKYSPPGSPIEVNAEIDDDMLQIEVADRGSGIPASDLERIFDKFYRVQRPGSVSGTGLGLSICKGIVEAHGGHIWAQNRGGGGASVTFLVPGRQSCGPACYGDLAMTGVISSNDRERRPR
jgi:two-component system sensor histidine kinase KdpD